MKPNVDPILFRCRLEKSRNKKAWEQNLHHSYENGANLCNIEVVKTFKYCRHRSGGKKRRHKMSLQIERGKTSTHSIMQYRIPQANPIQI